MRFIYVFFSTLAIALSALVGACASEQVDAVIKMQKEGAKPDALLTYVQSSKSTFDPSADDIQKLEDAGVPATVIVAMIDHDKTADPNAGKTVATTTTATETEVVAPPADQQDVSYFYEAMAPHGEWVQVENEWAWHPSVAVEADWRPYATNGHWVWTDAGWYWESNYAWGWAPFHYGRWSYHDKYHWIWSPDNVWGPAWVTWRASNDYYGWAPLPRGAVFESGVGFNFRSKHVGLDFDFGLSDREFNFVPATAFLEVDIGRHVLPRREVTNVYRQTTVVKNTYVVQNNIVINNGIPSQQVFTRTGHRQEVVRVTDANFTAGQRVRGELRSGNTIAVFRPKLQNRASVDPQTAIKRAERSGYTSRGATPPPAATGTPAPATRSAALSEADAKRRVLEEKTARQSAVQQRREDTRENTQQRQAQNAAEREAQRKVEEQKREQSQATVQQRQAQNAAEREAQRKVEEQKREQNQASVQQRQAQNEAERKAEEQKREQNQAAVQQRQAQNAAEREAQRKVEEQKREQNQATVQQRQAQNEAERKAEEQKREQNREAVQRRQQQNQAERETQRNQAEQKREERREIPQRPQTPVQPQQPREQAQPPAREPIQSRNDRRDDDKK